MILWTCSDENESSVNAAQKMTPGVVGGMATSVGSPEQPQSATLRHRQHIRIRWPIGGLGGLETYKLLRRCKLADPCPGRKGGGGAIAIITLTIDAAHPHSLYHTPIIIIQPSNLHLTTQDFSWCPTETFLGVCPRGFGLVDITAMDGVFFLGEGKEVG